MPREIYEFDISPEQLAGLVTDASDLQATADLIEGQIEGFLDKVVGGIGSRVDLRAIGRRISVIHNGSDHLARDQNIRGPVGRRDVYGVGLFSIGGRGGAWASTQSALDRAVQDANAWAAAVRVADIVRDRSYGTAGYGRMAAIADAAFNSHKNSIAAILQMTGGTLPAGVEGGPAAALAKDAWNRTHHTPPPDGEADSSNSIGPREHLWQSFGNLSNFGGRIEPAEGDGSNSLGARTPAIFDANDPTDEFGSTGGGSIYWWGSELIDPDPNHS